MDVPVEFQMRDTQQVLPAKGNSLPVLWRDVKLSPLYSAC